MLVLAVRGCLPLSALERPMLSCLLMAGRSSSVLSWDPTGLSIQLEAGEGESLGQLDWAILASVCRP